MESGPPCAGCKKQVEKRKVRRTHLEGLLAVTSCKNRMNGLEALLRRLRHTNRRLTGV